MKNNKEMRNNNIEVSIVNSQTMKKHDSKSKKDVSFEEALEFTGIGKYNYALIFISVYTLLAASAEIFSVSLILASSQCDLELDVYKKGVIGSVPMLGVIASAHLWGYIADTRGRKYTLTVTMAGTFITSFIASFSNHWILLAVTKFFSAACASGTNAVIYAMLGESTPESHRAKYLMYTATGVMFSQGIIAMIAYFILQFSFSIYIPILDFNYRPWRLLAQTFGLLSGINLILLLVYVFESAKFYCAKGNQEEGLNILMKIYSANTGKSPNNYPVKHIVLEEDVYKTKDTNIIKSMWNQTVPLFHMQHLKNTLLVCYICVMAFSVGPPIMIWLPVIFEVYSSASLTDKNFCELITKQKPAVAVGNSTMVDICDDHITDFTLFGMTVVSLYLVIITTISVIAIKYTGKKWMFIGIHVFSASCGLLLNHIFSQWSAVVFVGIMSCILCVGICCTYAVELFPTYLRAMGVCLTMMIGRAFSFIVINLMGIQLETNCENFLYIFSAFIFSGALVGLLLPPEKKNSEDVHKNKEIEDVS